MDMGSALLKISERVVEAAVAFNSKVHGPINLDLYNRRKDCIYSL